jgi:hypothetical protein
MRNRNAKIDIFIDTAITYTGDDCLIWPFATRGNNYPHIRDRSNGKYISVTRLICAKVHGPPPTPMYDAAHSKKCISKRCVNRNHLRWATRSDNLADDSRGEDRSDAKLTEEQVLETRQLAGTTTQKVLATQYGVTQSAIWCIIHRRSWAWLREPSDAELIWETTRPRMKDLFK